MIGDENTQPTENVSLDSIATLWEGEEEQEETLDVEGTDEEESEAAEEVDSEEEESDDEPEEQAKQTFTIKHDGKDVVLELTPAEQVEMLQKSFDYTQKTMAVAEERKAAEAERAAVASARQYHEQVTQEAANRLDALVQFYEGQLGEPPPIEWASQDANYYLVQKEQYEARKGQLQDAYAARHAVQEQQARSRHAWLMEQADATEKVLRDTLPGWSDDTLPRLGGYLAQFGLTPQTTDAAFVQKGLWELAHKAQQYDELLARKATLKPKAELPKVSKPSASKQAPRGIVARQAAQEAYRKKPSINTLADLLD